MSDSKPASPDQTVQLSEPTPRPSKSEPTQIIQQSEFPLSDLTSDPLLRSLPRMTFQGQTVPSAGGIPLLEKLGQGGMGAVYRGLRVLLQQEVAVKILPLHAAAGDQRMVERFIREAQVAARIESPNLVRVTDVAEAEGLFFLVMEYVRGLSARRLLADEVGRGNTGLSEAEALEICIAACRGLAAAHEQGIIHRDVKPDNILIPQDREGRLLLSNAKLVDLGLARSDEMDHSLTGTNIGMGTPGYMAPEQALSARDAGKPSDVFGLAATLYALLAGRPPFVGTSAASIMIATVQQPHAPIRETRKDVSDGTARLLDQCLDKNPARRFPDAAAMLRALQVCRSALSDPKAAATAIVELDRIKSSPEIGQPVYVSDPAPSRIAPAVVRSFSWRLPVLGFAAVLAVLTAFSVFLWKSRGVDEAGLASPGAPVPVGIAVSPEHAEWVRWAAQEFARTEKGRTSEVKVVSMSTTEAQEAFLRGDKTLHAWSPSNGIMRELFTAKWKERHGTDAIVRAEVLAVTPHVFVMLKSRYDAFATRYRELNFRTLRQALLEPGGWAEIGNKPDWGRFTFAMSRPSRYAGSLASLALISFDYQKKDENLTTADLTGAEYDSWISGFKRAFNVPQSPADLMPTMVLKGASSYDGVFTYESAVIDKLEAIEDRWEPLQVVYPRVNIWNEMSYYVMKTPWSKPEELRAAEEFLDFLLSDTAQRQLVVFGFRPANPRVHIHFPESPFIKYRDRGIRTDVPITVDVSSDVVAALMNKAPLVE